MPMNPVIAIISLGKAQQIGYHPDVILVGRLINDGMGSHVARRVAKLMAQRNLQTTQSRILVLGLPSRKTAPTCATPAWSTPWPNCAATTRRRPGTSTGWNWSRNPGAAHTTP